MFRYGNKKRLRSLFKALEKREELFRRINIAAYLFVLLSIFISWECFFIILALICYCSSIFDAGYRSQICDEWENGSIKNGLRSLRKGLMALPVIALAILLAFKTDSVYKFYIGFKNSGLRYLFTGILYFAVACALLNTLKESYRYRKNNDNFR